MDKEIKKSEWMKKKIKKMTKMKNMYTKEGKKGKEAQGPKHHL